MTTAVADPLGSSSVHNGRSPASTLSPASSAAASMSSPRGRGEPIPSGSLRSLRSRRTELDTDLHSTSSHSRRSVRSRGVRSVLSLHKTHSTSNLYGHHHHPLKATVPGGLPLAGPGGGHPPPAYATRGIANYEDTDNESSSCSENDDDDAIDGGSSSNDSCSTFAESTNECVANNRYLRRGMSIEIGAVGLSSDGDVSEFDDFAALDGDGDDPNNTAAALIMNDDGIEADMYDELLLLASGGGAGTSDAAMRGITTSSSVVSGSSSSGSSSRAAAVAAAVLVLDPLEEEASAVPGTDSPPSTPPESPALAPASPVPPLTPPQELEKEEAQTPMSPLEPEGHVLGDGEEIPSRQDNDDVDDRENTQPPQEISV